MQSPRYASRRPNLERRREQTLTASLLIGTEELTELQSHPLVASIEMLYSAEQKPRHVAPMRDPARVLTKMSAASSAAATALAT